jgi:hypothetical protein
MKTRIIYLVLIIFLLKGESLFSQVQTDTSNMYTVETMDGNNYTGSIISEDADKIDLKTDRLGLITIRKPDIKNITRIKAEKIVDGKLWFENPQSSRYFWAPNGYGLKKGEGYYQNIWVLWNQASFGFSDYFSIGLGVIPLFFFGGEAGQYTPIWIVPKFSIPVVKDKFNVGAGMLAANLGLESHSGFGIAYGLGTIGDRNNNLTLGLGYGYVSGDWAKSPMVTISGMTRVGPKGYFLTENYYMSVEDSWVLILSFGGRSFVRKVGIDYGLFIPAAKEMDTFIALPWLGITIPFDMTKK